MIIIGAGVAGLAAAQELRLNQLNVIVLEANDRIGGRIWSIHPWGGASIELGASWIHGIANNPLMSIVNLLNLPIQTTTYNHDSLVTKLNASAFYNSDGTKLAKEEIDELIPLAKEFMEAANSFSKEVGCGTTSFLEAFDAFAEKKNLSRKVYLRLYHLTVMMVTFEYASDLHNISIQEERLYGAHRSEGDNVLVLTGYYQIPALLAENVSILLNQRVKQVDYNASGVRVLTEDRLFKAKYAISTLPLGILKSGDVLFNPPLPPEKQRAINALEMGLFNKIYLFFPEVFWDNESEWLAYIPDEQNRDKVLDIMNLSKFFYEPILLAFTAGAFAREVEEWSDEETISNVMSVLRKIYGEEVPNPSSYVITRWGKDPHFKGSYSFIPTGSHVEDYEAMAAPVENRLFFAGEAAAVWEPSSVHGAYVSGVEAGQRICQLSG